MITLLLIIALIVYSAYQIITFVANGGAVSKIDQELYCDLDTRHMYINEYDSDKISLPYKVGRGRNAIRVPSHLYGKYKIDNQVGMIKKGSKLHKEIERYFKEVEDRETQNRIKNARQYKINKEEPVKENKSERPDFVKEEYQVIPTEIRDLFEELIKGKPVEVEGKKYKLVEEGNVTEQLDKMLKEDLN